MLEASDQALLLRAREGDAAAFGELVRRYQGSVYNVCYRLLGERQAAEDQAQEAFIRAYRRLETFDLDRPFGPWMRRVAANLCLNRLQAAPPPDVELDDELLLAAGDPLADPAAVVERDEAAEALRAAIRALPPRQRAVLELRHFHEMSYAEIGAELELPVSDVKSDLFRARRLLAERLRPNA